MNEREARTHPRKNVLNQALGAGHQFVDPQITAHPCAPGDRFVICSDGLIDGLWDAQIEEIVRAPGDTPLAQRLVSASLASSGRDNISTLVVEILPIA